MSSSRVLWLLLASLGIIVVLKQIFSGEGQAKHLENLSVKEALKSQKWEQPFPYLELREGKWLELKELNMDNGKWVFSREAQAMNGKKIAFPGFIFGLESNFQESSHFGFSALPIDQCFFCGKAGIETVLEVYADNPLKFTGKKIKIEGIFVLNENDSTQLPYQLHHCRLLE